MTNSVVISGRLVRDPEIQLFGESRFPIMTMSVAVDNAFGRFNRETKKTEVESGFYSVEIIGDYGASVGERLNKGDQVRVWGSLTQYKRTNEKTGETTSHTRIRGEAVMSLNRPKAMQQNQSATPPDPYDGNDPWARATPTDRGSF